MFGNCTNKKAKFWPNEVSRKVFWRELKRFEPDYYYYCNPETKISIHKGTFWFLTPMTQLAGQPPYLADLAMYFLRKKYLWISKRIVKLEQTVPKSFISRFLTTNWFRQELKIQISGPFSMQFWKSSKETIALATVFHTNIQIMQ